MATTSDSSRELNDLAQARANVIQIVSYEWERVRGLIIALGRELRLPAWAWNRSQGLLSLREEETGPESGDREPDPMRLLEEPAAWLGKSGGVLLLEDIHPYLSPQNHEIIRWVRQWSQRRDEPRGVLILGTPLVGLPMELRKEVPTIELPLPGSDDLRVVCERVAEQQGVKLDANTDPLVDAARGLTVMEATLAFGLAANKQRRLGASAVPLIVREKERVIKQSEVLEFYPADARMADVGGLDQLKQWLDRRGQAFGAGARNFGLEPPKGVLLLGIQGCGKSLTAKAVAATWQFPLLRLDVGKVFGSLVGQSEGNLRAALQVAQALAPCVLWVDEIEKGLAGMGSSDRTDGGTTARVVGTLLTWLQEKRAPVFVVATANRIELLPPELLRKGRFDEIFFVDLPGEEARKEILRIHLKKKEREPSQFDLDRLARESVGYSGAELEEAVREGLFEAFAAGKQLRTDHVADALRATYPLSKTMRDQIEQLRRWAQVRARQASSSKPEALPAEKASDVPRLRQETRNPFIPRSSSEGTEP